MSRSESKGVLVLTGASGLIGDRLLRVALDQGWHVRALTRRPSEWTLIHSRLEVFTGDIAQPNDWATLTQGANVVVNVAAEIRCPNVMYEVNVVGPLGMLKAAISSGVEQWVQLSSVGAYGPVVSGLVTENCRDKPFGVYESTKTEFDAVLRKITSITNLKHTIIRPSIVYGPGMRNHSLNQMMALLRKGWFVFIGSKGSSANYVHVDDVVQAVILSLLKPAAANQTYIVSDWATMEDMVAAMIEGLQAKLPTFRVPFSWAFIVARCLSWLPKWPLTPNRLKALTNRSRYCTKKIEQELGWVVTKPIKLGMKQLAEEV